MPITVPVPLQRWVYGPALPTMPLEDKLVVGIMCVCVLACVCLCVCVCVCVCVYVYHFHRKMYWHLKCCHAATISPDGT